MDVSAGTDTEVATRRGALLVVAAALGWAAIGLFVEPLLDRGLTPGTIAFWRALIGGVLFVTHAVLTGQRVPAGSRRTLIGFGIVGVGIFYLALPQAIDTGGVSLAWLLLYTAPAWVALLAPVVLKEPTDRATLGMVGATVVGVVLVSLGGGEGMRVTGTSVAWGLVAGLTYASWYWVSRVTTASPVVTGAVALPVGAVVLAPLASWPGAELVTWLLLLGLGLVSTWLAALAYYVGMRTVPAARGAVLATIEPVAALVLAASVFGERLAALSVAGAVLIAGAVVVAARRPVR